MTDEQQEHREAASRTIPLRKLAMDSNLEEELKEYKDKYLRASRRNRKCPQADAERKTRNDPFCH